VHGRTFHPGNAPSSGLRRISPGDDPCLRPNDRRPCRDIFQDDCVRADDSVISYGNGSSYDSTCIDAHAIAYYRHTPISSSKCAKSNGHVLEYDAAISQHNRPTNNGPQPVR